MWRPIFIIVLFVIVLWRELNSVKIPQDEANKSANRWGNLRAKGGVVPPSVYSILSLARVRIKYVPPTRLRCLFLLSTAPLFVVPQSELLNSPSIPTINMCVCDHYNRDHKSAQAVLSIFLLSLEAVE
jgi:hypothetical protein